MTFGALAVGTTFLAFGTHFVKTATSMAKSLVTGKGFYFGPSDPVALAVA